MRNSAFVCAELSFLFVMDAVAEGLQYRGSEVLLTEDHSDFWGYVGFRQNLFDNLHYYAEQIRDDLRMPSSRRSEMYFVDEVRDNLGTNWAKLFHFYPQAALTPFTTCKRHLVLPEDASAHLGPNYVLREFAYRAYESVGHYFDFYVDSFDKGDAPRYKLDDTFGETIDPWRAESAKSVLEAYSVVMEEVKKSPLLLRHVNPTGMAEDMPAWLDWPDKLAARGESYFASMNSGERFGLFAGNVGYQEYMHNHDSDSEDEYDGEDWPDPNPLQDVAMFIEKLRSVGVGAFLHLGFDAPRRLEELASDVVADSVRDGEDIDDAVKKLELTESTEQMVRSKASAVRSIGASKLSSFRRGNGGGAGLGL